MKLLYCIVLLGLIQYGLTAFPVKPSRLDVKPRKLLHFYKQLMMEIDREEFAAFKQLFEKLLQDDRIKRGSTPTFQNFKKNANEFLKKYPSASDSELNSSIVNIHTTIGSINNNKNILKSMYENGLEKMLDNYMKSYVSMVKEKFIPKFEYYKKKLTPKELKKQQTLMEWFENLKACSNYYCYTGYFNEFPQTLKL